VSRRLLSLARSFLFNPRRIPGGANACVLLRCPALAQTSRTIAVSHAQSLGRRVVRHQVLEQSRTHSRPCNEMLATRLGLALGLPMPRVEVIEVSDWLVELTPEMRIQLGDREIPCQSGEQLASLYVGTDSPGLTVDDFHTSCCRASRISRILLNCVSWTSAPAMPMGGRRSSRA
jgi:hypothetical protein